MRIKTIVFPVDFSARSRLAVPYVRAAVEQYQAKPVVMHVVDPVQHMAQVLGSGLVEPTEVESRLVAQARTRLEAFARQELTGLHPELVVGEGEAAHLVVEMARRRDADWIMMPTHGFAGFRRFVLGSVTARVLHDAVCPVWTAAIREDGQDAASPRPRVIVCAVDLEEHSEKTVAVASAIAQEFNAELRVVHATPSLANTPALLGGDVNDEVAHRAYQALGALLGAQGVHAHVEVYAGEPARVVRGVALERRADLVVIARGVVTEGMGRLRAHSYGIINESPCPVLSV